MKRVSISLPENGALSWSSIEGVQYTHREQYWNTSDKANIDGRLLKLFVLLLNVQGANIPLPQNGAPSWMTFVCFNGSIHNCQALIQFAPDLQVNNFFMFFLIFFIFLFDLFFNPTPEGGGASEAPSLA